MIKKIEIDVELNPMDLAVEFCNMNGHCQAEFFNSLAKISESWDRDFCFQLQYIVDSEALSDAGREVMTNIGKYSD